MPYGPKLVPRNRAQAATNTDLVIELAAANPNEGEPMRRTAENDKQAIAILAHQPDLNQVEFYKEISAFGYDILVIVDDNDVPLP